MTGPDKANADFEELKDNLLKQLASLERDDLGSADKYQIRARQICQRLGQQGFFTDNTFARQSSQIAGLYHKLELAIKGRMQQSRQQIQEIRKAGKLLRSYDPTRI